jgi:hypothetical protein
MSVAKARCSCRQRGFAVGHHDGSCPVAHVPDHVANWDIPIYPPPLPMLCHCGDRTACVFCGECLGCGPGVALCDARDHCDDALCRMACSLCRSMARDDRRGP